MYPPRNKHRPLVKEDKKVKEKDKDKDKEKDKDREKDKEKDKDHDRDHIESMIEEEEQKAVLRGLPMSWLNAIIGRICFDLLRSPLWRGRIHQRLQKKLSTLKVVIKHNRCNFILFLSSINLITGIVMFQLPYFMEALTITEMDLGNTVPVFHRASQPSLDVRGLWVELDMTYQGNFRMTIESKLNLMKLKRSTPEDNISLVSSSSSSVNLPEVFPVLATSDISTRYI